MNLATETESDGTRLKKKFEALKSETGMNKAQFARAFGVPGGASMISQHISGHRPIGLDAVVAYTRGFKCGVAEISPTLAAQLPPPADNLPISEQKQPLAGESIGSGAIDINTNRRGPLAPQALVAALGVLLAGVEPTRAASVAGLLADFARSPGDAWVADTLARALAPDTADQPGQQANARAV